MNVFVSSSGRQVARLLVTGANGFIGKAIIQRLSNDHVDVVGAGRHHDNNMDTVISPSLGASADWRFLLSDRTVVIHTAGRAHFLKERTKNPIELFREVNAIGTLKLAAQAAEMGVRRFVFLSSIGVNGTHSSCPFVETDIPHPIGPYAVSKLEAEQGLIEISQRSNMEVVIIRPPLVYGSNAPGNFGRLMRAVKRRLPLPLGAVTQNRRTLVGLDNLVDLVLTCAHHPAAANQIFLAGDDEVLSTTQLLRKMAQALGEHPRLLFVPIPLLRAAAATVGKGAMINSLCGSLEVDISKARRLLGWSPSLSVDEGLRRAAEGYLRETSV